MAELLGFSHPNGYSRKENGEIVFTLEEAKKISFFLGKTMDELFFNPELTLGVKNE